MPIIKPVSDLRNYNEVLKDCGYQSPIFLTKNGRGRYVLMDIAEYERISYDREVYEKVMHAEKQFENGETLTLEECRDKLLEKYGTK